MEKIKVGDTVEWSSQAGGSWVTKRGKVVAKVPAGESPHAVHERLVAKTKMKSTFDSRCFFRKQDGFFVLVPAKTPKSLPTLYWPIASKLKKIG